MACCRGCRCAGGSASAEPGLSRAVERLLDRFQSPDPDPADPVLDRLEHDVDLRLAEARRLAAGPPLTNAEVDAWMAADAVVWRRLAGLRGARAQVVRLKAKGVLLGCNGRREEIDFGDDVAGLLAADLVRSALDLA